MQFSSIQKTVNSLNWKPQDGEKKMMNKIIWERKEEKRKERKTFKRLSSYISLCSEGQMVSHMVSFFGGGELFLFG